MRINYVSISRFDADRTEVEMGPPLDSLRTPTLEIFHTPTQESFSTPTLEFKTPSDGIDGAVSLPVILARKLPASVEEREENGFKPTRELVRTPTQEPSGITEEILENLVDLR